MKVRFELKRVYHRVVHTRHNDLEILRLNFNSILVRFNRLFGTSIDFTNKNFEEDSLDVRLFKEQQEHFGRLGLDHAGSDGERNRKKRGRKRKTDPTKRKTKKTQQEEKSYAKARSVLKGDGFSKPIWNGPLYSTITGNSTQQDFRLAELPRQTDVTKTSEETLRRFTSDDVCPSGCILVLLIKAGFKAGSHIGFFLANGEEQYMVGKIGDAVDGLSKNTNSGAPEFGRKNDPKVQKSTKAWLRDLLHRPNAAKVLSNNFSMETETAIEMLWNPSKIFYRFQVFTTELSQDIIEFGIKIRQIFCIPFRICCLQYMFFHEGAELAEAKQKICEFPCYSTGSTRPEISTRHVGRIRKQHKYKLDGYSIFSGDFSKFDQTIPNIFFDIFFAIWETQINMSKHEKSVFNYLRIYMKYTPCIYRGVLFFLSKGIASGHYLTNLFDTWVHLTIVYAIELMDSNEEFEKVRSVITQDAKQRDVSVDWNIANNVDIHEISYFSGCGDDSIIYANIDFIYYYTRLCHLLGLKITFEKVQEDPRGDIFYLGTYWDGNNEPFQTDAYMASHVVFQERWKSKEELLAKGFESVEHYLLSRTLSICLRFKNGYKFLRSYLKGWEPFEKWDKDSEAGLFVVPKWPLEDGYFLERYQALHWSYY